LEAEIPEDVKRLANEAVYGDGGWHKVGEVVAVARAIMAERERAAKVAESYYGGPAHTYASENGDRYLAQDQASAGIARLIRKGA
jgi:hypothetical protein